MLSVKVIADFVGSLYKLANLVSSNIHAKSATTFSTEIVDKSRQAMM